MKKVLIAIAVMLMTVATVMAAPNPSGTGQPGADCEAIGVMPPGFGAQGFQQATTVYAGSGASVNHANSGNAVSQYDVACFQQSMKP